MSGPEPPSETPSATLAEDGAGPRAPGVALALSGGGYRAMVFHAGALWRLNEAGLLPRLALVSSVSGGSIAAGALALAWPDLAFGADGVASRFDTVVDRVRTVAGATIDVGAILRGLLLPGTISGRIAAAYDRLLFKGATLQDLPDDAGGRAPRFVFNAANVQTGALWYFTRDYMGDYRVGHVQRPRTRLCDAVAASSAFPPLLSPAVLRLDEPVTPLHGADLSVPPYTQRAVLSDGGVYDNLGLEPTKHFATLLVSDGGQKIAPQPAPHRDWPRHVLRVLDVEDNQVRSLRKRHLIESYEAGLTGTYWGIRTDAAGYGNADDPLGTARRDPTPLAALPTRLRAMPRDVQDKLINWGYAVCDAALRAYIAPPLQAALGIRLAPPHGFPCPGGY